MKRINKKSSSISVDPINMEDEESRPVGIDVDSLLENKSESLTPSNEDYAPEISDELLSKDLENPLDKVISKLEKYKIVLDTRKFEIDNFWRRALFFWGALTIVIIGYANQPNDSVYLIFLAYLGFIYNLIFSLSLRGSKYWQEHWEAIAEFYEKALKTKIFNWGAHKAIVKKNSNTFPTLRPYRISVSKITMVLSDTTLLFWILLIGKNFLDLSNKGMIVSTICLFSTQCEINWFSTSIVLIPFFFFTYLATLFLYKPFKSIISIVFKKLKNVLK